MWGGVNLLIRLSSASLTDRGDWAGPPCHSWYPINAIVVEHIDSGFILTASFIRKHQMQLSYKSPKPYIIFEEKKFPFFQNVQLIDKYGHIPLHPWEMKGGWKPPPTPNSPPASLMFRICQL